MPTDKKKVFLNPVDKITIEGLAELAQTFPDKRWGKMTIRLRKTDQGAEVIMDRQVKFSSRRKSQ